MYVTVDYYTGAGADYAAYDARCNPSLTFTRVGTCPGGDRYRVDGPTSAVAAYVTGYYAEGDRAMALEVLRAGGSAGTATPGCTCPAEDLGGPHLDGCLYA